ncbi:MAG: glycosyltransferase family 2 protein, partial [Candidatus Omnitrophica bacterium]|nr:glycosyltransferase family 2 protein [Candidatus Omnitrophota bacterium]
MKSQPKISVCLATFNEEENIGHCLEAVKDLADEIIIIDGSSTDRTREIAESYGAKIIVTNNPPIFHINKQKALEACCGDWILQLDADERVSKELASEIKMIIGMSDEEIEKYQAKLPRRELFLKHQRLLIERDGKIGTVAGSYSAFFVPRLNYFLGKYLRFGGVYPDGVIRLVKRGRAYFPAKSVHEQIVINGRVGWLNGDLIHLGDPTFSRYLMRNNRYINLLVAELERGKIKKNLINSTSYLLIKPVWWFLLTQVRHKGILDGLQGIVFSFFSALRFPRAYWRYLKSKS